MVHLFDEETLGVWKIAGDMEREVLTAARSEKVVASDHAGHQKRRNFRIIALADEILVRLEIAGRSRQPADLGHVVFRELGVLPQISD